MRDLLLFAFRFLHFLKHPHIVLFYFFLQVIIVTFKKKKRRVYEVYISFLVYQEFWVGNEELVDIYEKRLGAAGYMSFKLGRTNNRGDGRFVFHCRFKANMAT